MFWDSIFPGLNGVMKAMWQLFLVIFVLPTQLLIRFMHSEKVIDSNRGEKKSGSQMGENEQQAGCREVVLSYANHLGYIARECMSREEIEKKIDSGIAPQNLANEIQARIDARPGIVLGHQTYALDPQVFLS